MKGLICSTTVVLHSNIILAVCNEPYFYWYNKKVKDTLSEMEQLGPQLPLCHTEA